MGPDDWELTVEEEDDFEAQTEKEESSGPDTSQDVDAFNWGDDD